MAEEERNTEQTTEESPEETVDNLVEGGETVEAGLDLGLAKGPALDQDEGKIGRASCRERV